MKRLAEATADSEADARRARHRKFPWCRLTNEFIDDPVFRVVADMAGVPLFQVQAFVIRLESLANKSTPRGSVAEFSALEFAAAHGMSIDEAAKIFAALEHPDIRWVDQEHVAGFYPRNPDKEDHTAGERDRRRKARKAVRKELAKRARAGAIDKEQRDSVEAILELLPDPELFDLKSKLLADVALESALSTSHARHGVALRGFVAATPRADQKDRSAAVDNSVISSSGKAEEAAEGQNGIAETSSTGHGVAPEQWIKSDGVRLVVDRMQEHRTRAELLVERWLRDLSEPEVLKQLMIDATVRAATSAQFLVMITDGLRRHRETQAQGQRLPLGPTMISAGVRKVSNG